MTQRSLRRACGRAGGHGAHSSVRGKGASRCLRAAFGAQPAACRDARLQAGGRVSPGFLGWLLHVGECVLCPCAGGICGDACRRGQVCRRQTCEESGGGLLTKTDIASCCTVAACVHPHTHQSACCACAHLLCAFWEAWSLLVVYSASVTERRVGVGEHCGLHTQTHAQCAQLGCGRGLVACRCLTCTANQALQQCCRAASCFVGPFL